MEPINRTLFDEFLGVHGRKDVLRDGYPNADDEQRCDLVSLCNVSEIVGANLKTYANPAYGSRYPPPGL